MKKTISILILSVFMMVAAAASSFAWNHHKKKGSYWGHGCIDLTQEEKAALKDERSAFLNITRELRIAAFNKKMALEKELHSGSPDSAKVRKIRKQIYSLKKEIQTKRQAHMKKVNEIVPGFAQNQKHHGFKGNGHCMEFKNASWQQ